MFIFTLSIYIYYKPILFIYRISFARTLYRESEINLLDDPLSAVDAHTCEHIFTRGILGILKGKGKTTVLVTHQVHLLPRCDKVIILDKSGNLESCCSYNEISPERIKTLSHSNDNEKNETPHAYQSLFSFGSSNAIEPSTDRSRSRSISQSQKPNQANEKMVKDGAKLIDEEDRYVGIVPKEVYFWFAKSGGTGRVLSIMALSIIARGVALFANFYLASWGSANLRESEKGNDLSTAKNIQYLNTYAWILLSGLGLQVIRYFFHIIYIAIVYHIIGII